MSNRPGGLVSASSKAEQETFETLFQISQLLNTGLDKQTLSTCMQLCQLGVNPEALASVVKEIKKRPETGNNKQQR